MLPMMKLEMCSAINANGIARIVDSWPISPLRKLNNMRAGSSGTTITFATIPITEMIPILYAIYGAVMSVAAMVLARVSDNHPGKRLFAKKTAIGD